MRQVCSDGDDQIAIYIVLFSRHIVVGRVEVSESLDDVVADHAVRQ